MIHKKFIPLLLPMFLSVHLFSQDGPGGVGNISGTSNLTLWLRADQNLNYTALDSVISWDDFSGNGLDFDSSTLAPTIAKSYSNGLPSVFFGQAASGLHLNNITGTDLFSTNQNSIIFVKRSSSGSTWFNWEETTTSTFVRFNYNSNLMDFYFPNNSNLVQSLSSVGSSDNIITSIANTPGFSSEIYINGTLDNTGVPLSALNAGEIGNLYLGTRDGTGTNGWTGYISEVIIYNTVLNVAEREIIENSLSSKYNISLTGNDYYNGDASGNGNFDFDVAGIGYDNASGTNHTQSVSAGVIISTTGTDWGDGEDDFVFIGRSNIENSATTNDCANLGIYGQRWNRSWYLQKTGNADLKIAFDFGEGINGSAPSSASDYELLFRATNSGNFSTVTTATKDIENSDQVYFTVTNANINNGYYTLGTTDMNNSPVIGGRIWYSYTDGDWDNWETWTLDPDGSLLINSTNSTPGASDSIYILNGILVDISFDNKACSYLEVRSGGILQVGTTTGHDFNSIHGKGRIRIASDNFPQGDTSNFIQNGTVEYTGSGTTYNITQQVAYYNLEINMDDALDTIVMLDSITINNNFTITKGVFKINNNTSTNILTLSISGNTEIDEEGQIAVGTGNTLSPDGYVINGTNSVLPDMGDYHKIFHQIYAYGNITNSGKIRLTNQSQPVYNAFTTNGAASLYFKNATDNSFTIYDSTLLYNLIIDKGTDRTYILTISSSNQDFFALYGPNVISRHTDAFIAPFDEADFELRKPLWIYHGTLKLTGNIYIPSLGEIPTAYATGETNTYADYCIGASGALWIAGSNVKVQTTAYTGDVTATGISDATGSQGIGVSGRLQVSAGTFSSRNSGGIYYWPGYSGEIILSGGTITLSQLRRTGWGAGKFSYIQSGGTLIIRGNESVGDETVGGEYSDGFGLLNFNDGDCIFQMSGGNIYIYDYNGDSELEIRSDEGNYSVTGGTITMTHNGGNTASIYSTSNLWNLVLVNRNATGTYTVNIDADLIVSNNLTVGERCTFDATGGNNNLSVGGNFNVGTSTAANTLAYYYPRANTTTLIGSGNSVINVYSTSATTGANGAFVPNNLTINKSISSATVSVTSNGRIATDPPINITGNFTITAGKFDYGAFYVDVKGNMDNSGTMGVWNKTGRLRLNSTTANQTITASAFGGPVFGHLDIDKNTTYDAILASNISCDLVTLTNGNFYIGSYKLSVDTNYIGGSGFSATKMIETAADNGARGLRYKMDDTYNSSTVYFPIGSNGNWDRAEILITGPVTTTGYLTVIGIALPHPSLNTGGGCSYTNYYWRTIKEGLTTLVTGVVYNFYVSTAGGIREWYLFTNDWLDDDNAPAGYLSYDANILNGFKTGEFTGSSNNCFNAVDVFTSVATGNWGTTTTWDRGAVPGTEDVVIIRSPYTVTITAGTQDASGVTIYSGGILDVGTVTGLDFARVKGGGKFRIASNSGTTPTVPTADWDEFLLNDTSVFEYYGTGSYTIPNAPTYYSNLKIACGAGGGTTKTLPDINFTVTNDLMIYDDTQNGVRLQLSNSATSGYNLTVGGDILFDNQGSLQLRATGAVRTVTVYGSIDFTANSNTDANSIIIEDAAGTYPNAHTLNIKGDVIMNDNSSLTLYRNNTTRRAVNLYFTGSENSEITSSTSSDIALNYLYIQKDALNDTVTLSSDFTLTNDSYPALTLTTGTLVLDNTGIDITLSSNDGNFAIPFTSEFYLKNATARITGVSGYMTLNGKLKLENSSEMLLTDGATANDNYIVYGSSGYSEIVVNDDAVLTVGSQIRRGTVTTGGALKYAQTGGTVTVGDRAAPTASRGVFEILNSGSSFTFTGGDIIIARASNSSASSLYLNPTTNNVAAGAYITIGKASTTPNSSVIGMYINVPVKNIRTIDNTTGTYEAKVFTVTLNLDTLNIAANTTFNCNAITVLLSGDFMNSGTFNGNNNTTVFNGAVQHLYSPGTSTFYNLVFYSTDTTYLEHNITVNNNLSIASGTFLNDNQKTITLLGDMVNEGEHYTPSTTLGGVVFNGTYQQEISGTGTFGRLEINNSQGVELQNDFVLVDNVLTFTNGNLYIRDHAFTLGENSDVSGSYNSTHMIISNGAYSDKGVIKNLSSGTTTNILIPIGTIDKYTPFTITSITTSSPGSITVIPVNEPHPTATNKDNVLQYYWTLKNSSLTNISANFNFKYIEGDVKITGDNLESDYIPAYLEDAAWAKYGEGNVNTTNNLIDYNFISKSTLAGDYTAGIDTAIPDNVPVYITTTSGNWEDFSIWEIEDDGAATKYPDGYIVKINHDVTITQNLKSAYKTMIEAGATLYVDSTIGHYLGAVSGNGNIRVKRGKLPAGDYELFLSCDGGSIEYSGLGVNYTIPDEGSTYRKLVLSGSGTRILPDLDLTICDSLIVDKVTLDNDPYDNTISIKGLFLLQNGGLFKCGSGTVIYNGTSPQVLGGFSYNNAFYNFTINNSSGITLNGTVGIKNILTLTTGTISTDDDTLRIKVTGYNKISPSTGTTSSYIDGPLYVELPTGTSFTFPVGDARRGKIELNSITSTGTNVWKGQYVSSSHSNTTAGTGVSYVSTKEYWRITQVTGGTGSGYVRIRWDNQSDINGISADGMDNIRLAQYDGSTAWDAIGTTYDDPPSTNLAGTIPSDAAVTFNATLKEFTLGSFLPLLASANFITGDTTICPGTSVNIDVNLTGLDTWKLVWTLDGTGDSTLDIATSPYSIVASIPGTYRLIRVYEDWDVAQTQGYVDVDTVVLSNSDTIIPDAGLDPVAFCLGGNTAIGGTPAGSGGTGALTYSWSPSGSLSSSTVQNPIATPTSAGITTYILTVTDNIGCEATDTVDVTINPLPIITWTNADNPACALQTGVYIYSINDPGSHSFGWSINPTGTGTINSPVAASTIIDWNQVTTGASRDIWVVIADTIDATQCTAKDSVQVTVNRQPETGDQYYIPPDYNE